MYLQYGDESFIRDNYKAMCRYADRIIRDCKDYIDIGGRYMGEMFGDWESYEHTPLVITETAYCAWSVHLLSKMASIIGENEDAMKYEKHYECFREAWNREFVNDDGSMKCDPKKYGTAEYGNMTDPVGGTVRTQAAYVLGLQFGLFNPGMEKKAAANLASLIMEQDYRLHTGFAGVSYINPVLTEYGYSDAAYRLFCQREFPSWLFPVMHGATTIYESWQSYIEYPDGRFRYLISMNHFPFGSVVEWLYRYVGGIETDESAPGFRKIILQPVTGGGLEYVKCSYDSVYGLIESNWTATGNVMTSYEAVIPANSSATLYLPADKTDIKGFRNSESVRYIGQSEHLGRDCAKFELESGRYLFRFTDRGLRI